MTTPSLFHLAFPVDDLRAARAFYGDFLGCPIGRESNTWIDFNFYGHQITCHLVARMPTIDANGVDDKQVPTSHFGAILDWQDWHVLADKLKVAGSTFLIEPYIRFVGQPGEQATMFITDPSGNGLEFKSFKDPSRVFTQ